MSDKSTSDILPVIWSILNLLHSEKEVCVRVELANALSAAFHHINSANTVTAIAHCNPPQYDDSVEHKQQGQESQTTATTHSKHSRTSSEWKKVRNRRAGSRSESSPAHYNVEQCAPHTVTNHTTMPCQKRQQARSKGSSEQQRRQKTARKVPERRDPSWTELGILEEVWSVVSQTGEVTVLSQQTAENKLKNDEWEGTEQFEEQWAQHSQVNIKRCNQTSLLIPANEHDNHVQDSEEPDIPVCEHLTERPQQWRTQTTRYRPGDLRCDSV